MKVGIVRQTKLKLHVEYPHLLRHNVECRIMPSGLRFVMNRSLISHTTDQVAWHNQSPFRNAKRRS